MTMKDEIVETVAREFVEAEGLVHLVNGEFTLCGDAFDLDSDIAGYEWQATRRRTVTCPGCADIIAICRGVRTNQNKGSSNAG